MKRVDYKQVYTQGAHRQTANNLFYTQVYTAHAIHKLYTVCTSTCIRTTNFIEYHRHIHGTIDRLVICTGLYYTGLYGIHESALHA